MASTLSTPDPSTDPAARERRRWRTLVVVAALVAAAGVVLAIVVADDDESASGPPLELSLGVTDALASCLPVDPTAIAAMPVALAGTAAAVDGEQVTLTVDEWYAGGDAGTVVLHAEGGQVALTGGIDFAEGQRYLVAATSDGAVAACGLSGPATAELQGLYDEAFAG